MLGTSIITQRPLKLVLLRYILLRIVRLGRTRHMAAECSADGARMLEAASLAPFVQSSADELPLCYGLCS